MKIKNPAFDYNQFGQDYSGYRRSDPRIAAFINEELENLNTILNVGAGAGSYEPIDKYVVAVEPSFEMRKQRIANKRNPAINAFAESLPFDNNSFDASMAIVTVHHWPDMKKGLLELKRVSEKKVIIMTFDPDCLDDFWNAEYFPEVIAIEKQRYPKNEFIFDVFDVQCDVKSIPVPLDCIDGFQEAFYGRPEAFLNKNVRLNQSAWGFLPEGIEEQIVKRLEEELRSGEWDKKYGHYRKMPSFTCALKLIVAHL